MAQIRNTIELLTKIYRENGTTKVKAETFRLAKFNEDDAVVTLWKLLFELLYFCEFGKIDDVSVRASGEFTKEELAVYVKTELQKRNFISRDLANLPLDMSTGSRELLLALGWLMCKEDIIAKFMKTCTSPLEEQDTAYLYKQDEEFSGRTSNLPQFPQNVDPVARVKQLLWFNNKLRLSLRSLHAMQREKNRLQHKIHEATVGVSLTPDKNHLSMLEVYMLRKPDLLKKNLQLLEKDNERLQNLLKWRDHEDIFWKWMESVLDAKIQDKEKKSGAGDGNRGREGVPRESVARLHESRLNLQEAIVKYEAIVDHLDRVWDEKSSDISEEELDTVLSSLDLELSIQKANIALHNTESYVNTQNTMRHQCTDTNSPKLIFQKKLANQKFPLNVAPGLTPVSSNPVSVGTSSMITSVSECKDIEEEVERLQSLVNTLEEEVENKQEAFKQEMQNLSSQFKDAISIPPMARHISKKLSC